MLTEFDTAGLRDRVLLLRSMEALSALDDESLRMVAEYSRVCRFDAGHVLMRDGEPIRAVYIVVDGEVEVSRKGTPVATVRRSFGVGFVSTLARDPEGVHAVTTEDTVALELPVTVLLDAFEESWPLLRNSLRLAAMSVLKTRGALPTGPGADSEVSAGEARDRPLTFVERVIEMRSAPLFRGCNLDAVIEMVRPSREVRGTAGDVLWRIGQPPHFYVRIDYGIMRCSAPDGRSVRVGAGQVLGAMDTLSTEPRAYDVVAETDYGLLRIEHETMLAVLEAHHKLAMNLQAVLSGILLQGN